MTSSVGLPLSSVEVKNESDVGLYIIAESPIDSSTFIPEDQDFFKPNETRVIHSKTHIPVGKSGVLKLTIWDANKVFIFEGIAPAGRRVARINPEKREISYDEIKVVCDDGCVKNSWMWSGTIILVILLIVLCVVAPWLWSYYTREY